MKKLIFLIIGFHFIVAIKTYGQADVGTATHWYNRANFNPASISRPGYIYFFSNARQQWTGIEGAPKVYNIQASGFSENHNSAFGLSFIKDDIGLTTAINPSLLYAYRVGVNDNMFLSLGLSAGYYSRTLKGSNFQAEIINDPALIYSDQKFSSPDANVGIELQSKHFLFGLSVDHLFSIWKPDDELLISNHQYAYAIYRNSDSELFNFTGGIQVANRNNLTVAEVTAIVRFKRATGLVKGPSELFDLGITLRTVEQFTFLTGINISPHMRIGYTYDFDFGLLGNKTGTHEIILEYRIPLKSIIDNGYIWYD